MAMTDDTRRIFEDARLMSTSALTLLDTGDIRDAAEKAWCAVKRAADGLISARTGMEPRTSSATWRSLRAVAADYPLAQELVEGYRAYQRDLHGRCFYYGDCEPADAVVAAIRDTASYVQLAERLAIS